MIETLSKSFESHLRMSEKELHKYRIHFLPTPVFSQRVYWYLKQWKVFWLSCAELGSGVRSSSGYCLSLMHIVVEVYASNVIKMSTNW